MALDPDFAEGWVTLAGAHIDLGIFGLGAGSRDDLLRAREPIQRALALDERQGGAHAALGNFRLFYDWDFSGARSACERAVELSPSDPAALLGLAAYLRVVGLGDSPEAKILLERLLRVAPLDLYIRRWRASHFLFIREYERGIAEHERIRELAPEYVAVDIAFAYALLGRPEDAAREMLAFLVSGGAAFDQAREASQRGFEEEAWQGGVRALTRFLIEMSPGASGMAYSIAMFAATIGETEEAMTWLERAYEERDPLLLLAKVDPRGLDSLRSDPRFQDLLRRIGFPES